MRLSEAVRLGSLLVERPAKGLVDKCAVGMGVFAHDGAAAVSGDQLYARVMELWPWLRTHEIVQCPRCGLHIASYELHMARVKEASLSNLCTPSSAQLLWHPFDLHVFGDKTMTIEQLADFIASIEPQEEAATGEDWGDVDDSLLRRRGQDTSAPHDGSTISDLEQLVEEATR